jgi:predicted site-specific integrase-resolvase
MRNGNATNRTLVEMDRRYLRRHEVAHRLQVSTSTLDNWVRAGRIPVVSKPLGRGRGRIVHFDWKQVAKALKLPA